MRSTEEYYKQMFYGADQQSSYGMLSQLGMAGLAQGQGASLKAPAQPAPKPDEPNLILLLGDDE